MIEENVAFVSKNIIEAGKSVGRVPEEVTIIAVSKTFGIDRIIKVHEAGISNFGENRVQEAKGKIGQIDADIRWHFIGHLQSNKAKVAVSLFDVILSVDSFKLAQILNKYSGSLRKGKLDNPLFFGERLGRTIMYHSFSAFNLFG